MGRVPVGDCRVGCMGRRSPGRNGGRPAGAAGRGRWKIGWPGTGRPGAGRGVVLAAGRIGALYTGRGPVCGTIMRRAGGGGAAVSACIGGAAAIGGGGGAGFAGGRAIAGSSTMVGSSAAGGGAAGTSGAGLVSGFGGSGGAGTVYVGRGAGGGGTTRRGGGACGSTAGGAAATGGGATGGFGAATGGSTGGAVAAGLAGAAGFVGAAGAGGATVRGGAGRGVACACCCWLMAFSTSPGFEMCDRSNFGLMSSSWAWVRAARPAPPPSADDSAWKCARTFSASSTEMELEWVFFSVTPTLGRTSRIALLLTSSSLARSLILILSIRAFVSSELPLSLHSNLTVKFSLATSHQPLTTC